MTATPLANAPPADSAPTPPQAPTRSAHPLKHLFDPATIRLRCGAILRSVEDNLSPHFRLDRSALDACAQRVAATIRLRHPDLQVPPHSRWRHFDAGGVPRLAELAQALAGRSAADVARAHFDLVVPAVLLDAAAGDSWRYVEGEALAREALPESRHDNDALLAMLDAAARQRSPDLAQAVHAPAASGGDTERSGRTWQGSEGLAVASLRAFMAGAFSARRDDPLRCDAAALKQLDPPALRALMQAGPANPLAGLEERSALLQRLGQALESEALRDGGPARPALFFDRLTAGATRREVSATELLNELLRTLAPIWLEGSRVQSLQAGDCWPHRWAGDGIAGGGHDTTTDGHVPLHAMAQWLAYSLIEPLQWAGVAVTGQQALTGLADTRNGGLLIDMGVLRPRSARAASRAMKPADEWVIEWRALTVVLLDELAVLVRHDLGLDDQQLTMASLLEGGTAPTARELDQERRNGAPPVLVTSAGTLF